MYIAQVDKVLHDFWRYLIGIGIVIFGIVAFSMPHMIAIAIKTMNGSVDENRLGDTAYLMGLFEPNLNLIFVLLPFAGGLVFLLLTVKLLHKQTIRMLTTAREKIDWNRIWFAFMFWGVISTGLIFVDYYFNPEGRGSSERGRRSLPPAASTAFTRPAASLAKRQSSCPAIASRRKRASGDWRSPPISLSIRSSTSRSSLSRRI